MKKILVLSFCLLAVLTAQAWSFQHIAKKITPTADGIGPLFMITDTYRVDSGIKISESTEFINCSNQQTITYGGRETAVQGPELWHQEQNGNLISIIRTFRPISAKEVKAPLRVAATVSDEVVPGMDKEKFCNLLVIFSLTLFLAIVVAGIGFGTKKSRN
ncbi:MAG TPA: hypothetical protein PK526_04085 [bacterium]|nr:hypothetical protein [bacterium]